MPSNVDVAFMLADGPDGQKIPVIKMQAGMLQIALAYPIESAGQFAKVMAAGIRETAHLARQANNSGLWTPNGHTE